MENQASTNPLVGFFRQPAIYISLPSLGAYWPEDAIELPATGDLPVYPMTARDEITLKTPDALLNGSGVVDVIQSCMPNIKNAWKIPSIDIDKILIAIRLATYGHEMDFRQTCPKCQEETEYAIDLRMVMDEIRPGAYQQPFTTSNKLTFQFRPHDFDRVNKANLMTFEEQRILAIATNTTADEQERVRMFNESLAKITNMTLDAMVASIQGVTVPGGGVVTNPAQILEFLNMTDAVTYAEVKDKIASLSEESKLKPLHLKCPECSNEFDTNLTFDQSHFFG